MDMNKLKCRVSARQMDWRRWSGLLQRRDGLAEIALSRGFGSHQDLPRLIPLSRDYDLNNRTPYKGHPMYPRRPACGRGMFYHGGPSYGSSCGGGNNSNSNLRGFCSKMQQTVVDYRDNFGIHDFAGRTPAHHPHPPSIDVGIHIDTDDFVMDGTPAPDYSAVAGPSSYDPMAAGPQNDVTPVPVEDSEVADDEGEITEDTAAAQDGDNTEDDKDL
ncbi:hypothetical protein BDN71DRAFT_1430387 [Pleurotus eryngii]|uniref:Uncharacterized protein n=1 Tax=Pleurotus eryngii TaxID=5323 RepID=A0A9P5ZZF4_PLEER|nr:hypothetical protein BDN71DRAFT_1430387 [Pleurotus eryngii]